LIWWDWQDLLPTGVTANNQPVPLSGAHSFILFFMTSFQ